MSSSSMPPRVLDATYPSICIPRTFANIRWQQVKTVFEVLFGKGTIERVDVARKTAKDGTKFNCMFVHFVEWPTDDSSQDVRQKLIDGKNIKIVYDEPWYWKCSMSRIPRPEKRYIANRPYIMGGRAVASSPVVSAPDVSVPAHEDGHDQVLPAPTLVLERPQLQHNLIHLEKNTSYEFKS